MRGSAGPDPEGIMRKEWVVHGQIQGQCSDTASSSCKSSISVSHTTSRKADRSCITLIDTESTSNEMLHVALHSHVCLYAVPGHCILCATLSVNSDHQSHGRSGVSISPTERGTGLTPQGQSRGTLARICLLSKWNNRNQI